VLLRATYRRLDIDLALASIKNPDAFPLVAR